MFFLSGLPQLIGTRASRCMRQCDWSPIVRNVECLITYIDRAHERIFPRAAASGDGGITTGAETCACADKSETNPQPVNRSPAAIRYFSEIEHLRAKPLDSSSMRTLASLLTGQNENSNKGKKTVAIVESTCMRWSLRISANPNIKNAFTQQIAIKKLPGFPGVFLS